MHGGMKYKLVHSIKHSMVFLKIELYHDAAYLFLDMYARDFKKDLKETFAQPCTFQHYSKKPSWKPLFEVDLKSNSWEYS